jgi:hypothetical protein
MQDALDERVRRLERQSAATPTGGTRSGSNGGTLGLAFAVIVAAVWIGSSWRRNGRRAIVEPR